MDFTQGVEGSHLISRALRAPIIVEGQERYEGWRRIARFGRQWENPDSALNRAVGRIGWEFDMIPDADPYIPPSMFMELRSPDDGGNVSSHTVSGILSCLDILKPDLPEVVSADPQRCIDLCPDEGGISQFGVLLSRPIKALRLNMWGITPDTVGNAIQNISGMKPDSSLEKLVGRLSSAVSRFMLCFNLGDGVPARFGLECVPTGGGRNASGWIALFDALMDLELCHKAEGDALLEWPSDLEPFNASTPWPEELMIDSLQSPPNRFTVFQNILNHIKVDWFPDRPPSAKAYLSFQHVWDRVVSPPSENGADGV